MLSMISPTDSRMRRDIVLYENDEVEEADTEKMLIEDEQRRKRKLMEEGQLTWKPKFFEPIPHPYLKHDSLKHRVI